MYNLHNGNSEHAQRDLICKKPQHSPLCSNATTLGYESVCTHLHIRGHEFTCILCCKSKYIHPQVLETNESHLRVSTGKIITLLSTDVEKFHLVSRLPKPNPSVSAYYTSNISRYCFLSLQSSMHQIALLHCVKFIVSKLTKVLYITICVCHKSPGCRPLRPESSRM